MHLNILESLKQKWSPNFEKRFTALEVRLAALESLNHFNHEVFSAYERQMDFNIHGVDSDTLFTRTAGKWINCESLNMNTEELPEKLPPPESYSRRLEARRLLDIAFSGIESSRLTVKGHIAALCEESPSWNSFFTNLSIDKPIYWRNYRIAHNKVDYAEYKSLKDLIYMLNQYANNKIYFSPISLCNMLVELCDKHNGYANFFYSPQDPARVITWLSKWGKVEIQYDNYRYLFCVKLIHKDANPPLSDSPIQEKSTTHTNEELIAILDNILSKCTDIKLRDIWLCLLSLRYGSASWDNFFKQLETPIIYREFRISDNRIDTRFR